MIVVDVETTGFLPEKHALLSIGAVDFNDPKKTFYVECQAWEGYEVAAMIHLETREVRNDITVFDYNGFSKESVEDTSKPSLKEALEKFFAWAETCEDKTLAGHNGFFDVAFLRNSAERCDLAFPFGDRCVDLHTLGYTHLRKRGLPVPLKKKRSSIRSNDVFVYVGLPKEPMPHHGLTGAKMEAEAFSRLIHGRNLLKEFANFPLPDYLKN